MTLRTLALTTAVAALLTLVAIPAAAHGSGHFGHDADAGPAGHILHMATVLDLSDDQKTRIEAVIAEHRDGASGEARTSVREAKETLAKTIHDPAATDDQVRDAAATVAALEAQLAVARHRMALSISAILTAEQKAKLAELRASARNRHHGPRRDDAFGF